jgi:hypothetical protein
MYTYAPESLEYYAHKKISYVAGRRGGEGGLLEERGSTTAIEC